ncbi:MAG: carbamoyl-phosphate synthase domain-containing protein, partial [Candidatus ainarchaeum sp.]|nr:carbamoyl-phosphate synthase domain-containing protein [Candidatus ainarchaeum sp.]
MNLKLKGFGNMDKKAILVLKDGSVFHGKGFGAVKSIMGELVFNTSMQGYQETLTDPSYAGQIVTMSYPLIGNYGLNEKRKESNNVQVYGFVVKELDNDSGIDKYLEKEEVSGIKDVDTRALVRKIRNHGVISAYLEVYTQKEPDVNKIIEKLNFDYSDINFIKDLHRVQIFEKCDEQKLCTSVHIESHFSNEVSNKKDQIYGN